MGKDRRLRWRVTDPLSGDVRPRVPLPVLRLACAGQHFERGVRHRVKQFTQTPGLPSGTDGIKKRRTGGLRIAFYSTKTRFDDRPSSHNASNGQTRKRAWQGETYRSVDKVSCLHGKSFISNLCNALTGCQFAKGSAERLKEKSCQPAEPDPVCTGGGIRRGNKAGAPILLNFNSRRRRCGHSILF